MNDDVREASDGGEPTATEPGDASRIDDAKRQPSASGGLTIILWALASIGLLGYVALGSTPAYIWRFGRKHQEFKSVLGTWTIEANNLPQVAQQWLMEGAFYGALIVFLLGVIVGMWFLLQARDGEAPAPDLPPAQDSGPTSA